ncbi:MAG: hypothetical protein HY319_06390 [Armatimonadetes bacterium]|nr:hypothetical protein [Armatimonadota bacterium]
MVEGLMLRYRLTAPPSRFDRPGQPRKTAEVLLRAGSREEVARIEYEGDPALVREIEERLLQSYGFRGRFIEEETSPMDLEIAMGSWHMEPFSPLRVEGLEVLENP